MDRRSLDDSIRGGSVIIEDHPLVGSREHDELLQTPEQTSQTSSSFTARQGSKTTSFRRVFASYWPTGQRENGVRVNAGNDSADCLDRPSVDPVENSEYLVLEHDETPRDSNDMQDEHSRPFFGGFLSRKVGELVSILSSFRRRNSTKDTHNDTGGLESQTSAIGATSSGSSSDFAQCQELLSKLAEILNRRDFDIGLVIQHGYTQRLMDLLQAVLDSPEQLDDTFRKNIIALMQRLSGAANCGPTTYILEPIPTSDGNFYASGTFGDVYRVKYKGRFLCVKKIGPVQSTKDQLQKIGKDITKEAILWGQLRHSNILPFYGFCEGSVRPCLISPWLEKGSVVQYLKDTPDADRYLLVKDIAKGLEYLHSKSIIHGDIKGANVLIDMSGRARLADFGLWPLFDSSLPDWAAHLTAEVTNEAYRWQAPELLGLSDLSSNESLRNTEESDVYAWACVCYEIFTGNIPFHNIKSSVRVLTELQKGTKPDKPPPDHVSWTKYGLTEDLWTRLEDSWGRIPSFRPNMQQHVLWLDSWSTTDGRLIPPTYDSPSKQRSKDRRAPLFPTLQSIDKLLGSLQDSGHPLK